ncbi:hypothetical protein MYCTH_2295100 [Thermothelomyces thermophilus ATCC 42464]|uniref:Uncharacterized protein n=1 Tax=Thermothelomyces thermophilus (strain ATCC 42464 / BCRC 31852 / DSM 1799) TaxID=573729 RepID=G2Q3M3_THET4|nr:uncharacterized protein MYCTH_2295100 [Thermothelomyces thermophilus ATCC 42464]AEO53579.1 hypothetical protein MYCTH_2295100 [Thermothelomyces thermophilus ATCC 42464]
MPSVAQESPTVQSSKKRRRDDNDHQMHPAQNSPRGMYADKTFHHGDFFHPSTPLAARKSLALPLGKRPRAAVEADFEADGELMRHLPYYSPSREFRQEEQHHPHQDYAQAEQRTRSEKISTTTSSGTSSHTSSALLMSRCHICSRKPNKKSDLDSFADCQGCGQRTCYVCIRECLGWGLGSGAPTGSVQTQTEPSYQLAATLSTTSATGTPVEEGEASFTMLDADDKDQQQQPQHAQSEGGTLPAQEQGWMTGSKHRQVVCSRCCVERGEDGEVVCLGCLPFVEG